MHNRHSSARVLGPLWLGLVLFLPFWLCAQEVEVGYGVFDLEDGRPAPATAALFRIDNGQGTLVSEAGVGAVESLRSGRIFVQQSAENTTGVALVNRSQATATLLLSLRDADGVDVAQTNIVLAPGEHRAKFVNELFQNLPSPFLGTLSFQVNGNDDQFAAVTLRQGSNAFGEPVLTTLPVADLSQPPQAAGTQSLVFPQVGVGGGLSTQLVLFARTSAPVQGTFRFFASDGTPLILRLNGSDASEFPFQIAADGTLLTELASPVEGEVRVGYAVVSVQADDVLPAGSAIFRFVDDQGTVISEAGVGSVTATTQVRLFVDNDGTRTGVAVANAGNALNKVDFDLLDSSGMVIASVSRDIPSAGHTALFADELFALAPGFVGAMEIRAALPLVPISLKLSTNQRGQSIVTTLPVADLENAATGSELIIPQMGIGSGAFGFSTRLIFVASDRSNAAKGLLSFRRGAGAEWTLNGLPADFTFGVGAGEVGRILFEGVVSPLVIDKGNSVSALITTDGGTIRAENASGDVAVLRLPPHALEQAETVTVTMLKSPPKRFFANTVFPGVMLEPDGLVLNEPAQLEIIFARRPSVAALSRLFWLPDATQVRAAGEQEARPDSLLAEIQHFSLYTGSQLTLAECLFLARQIAEGGRDSLPDFPFPEGFEEALVEFVLTTESVNTLEELEELKNEFGLDFDSEAETITAVIVTGAGGFLNAPIPVAPCGLYHSFLRKLVEIADQANDPDLDQALQDRLDTVDEECISVDLTGTWVIDTFDGSEQCRLVSTSGTSWEENEEDESVIANVVQDGSSFSISFPELPQVGTLMGRLQATGDDFQPFFFTVELNSSDTVDCRIFFETQGLGLDFGAPICVGGSNCVPLSCRESDTVTGSVSSNGQIVLGLEFWDFSASVRETPAQGNPMLLTYRCQGNAQVSGTKQ